MGKLALYRLAIVWHICTELKTPLVMNITAALAVVGLGAGLLVWDTTVALADCCLVGDKLSTSASPHHFAMYSLTVLLTLSNPPSKFVICVLINSVSDLTDADALSTLIFARLASILSRPRPFSFERSSSTKALVWSGGRIIETERPSFRATYCSKMVQLRVKYSAGVSGFGASQASNIAIMHPPRAWIRFSRPSNTVSRSFVFGVTRNWFRQKKHTQMYTSEGSLPSRSIQAWRAFLKVFTL